MSHGPPPQPITAQQLAAQLCEDAKRDPNNPTPPLAKTNNNDGYYDNNDGVGRGESGGGGPLVDEQGGGEQASSSGLDVSSARSQPPLPPRVPTNIRQDRSFNPHDPTVKWP